MSLEKKVPELFDTEKFDRLASLNLVHLPSGFPVFDRVFHGGFLESFVYFTHADRGAGKTSFLLQVCAYLASLRKSVVFFSFDESLEGIQKKCRQYGLINNMPFIVSENSPGIIDRTLSDRKPDFVVLDNLDSFAGYERNDIVKSLFHIKNSARRYKFALVVVGEERKDRTGYLGSAHIGHIVDVIVKMETGKDAEVIISTHEKNRDTDDKSCRCFFKRTPAGLVEIQESETGYLSRHSKDAEVGRVSFVTKCGNDFTIDEMTAIEDKNANRSTLTIAGMSRAKSKSLLMVILDVFVLPTVSITLRANRIEKLYYDAELASMIAALSLIFRKPVPVDTVLVGGVDNRGYLLPVDGMELRVKRAKALGYKRIIGPKANGTQIASWEEMETLKNVWEAISL
jgi:DNA repair protein RadA/Sms